DDRERALVARDATDGCRGARRGLVVRPRVDVDARGGLGQRDRAGLGRAHVGRLEPRRAGGLGELAAELAERAVLAALLDEAEGRGVPERRRATVAEDDLVALGQAEQLREPLADASHEVLHGRLAVRSAEERGSEIG